MGGHHGRQERVAARVVWWAMMALLVACTALSLERRVTWYLAVDQFGFLTLARDLLHGRVFHQWAPLDGLVGLLPPRTDVLAQTYVLDHGRLHCRYAPGFPLLLAGWTGLFGEDAAHYLNPSLFLLLLGVLTAFQRRVFPSPWHAGAGTALVLLFPTTIRLWAVTVTRDLATHLFAFAALLVLLPGRGARLTSRRTALAGGTLGFALSIRPDAVLYLVPAGFLALLGWQRDEGGSRDALRLGGSAVLGLVAGMLPFLTYNFAVTGNPLWPTQAMELSQFLPTRTAGEAPSTTSIPDPPPADGRDGVAYVSPVWHGGTSSQVQGGGLRLTNLPRVLPGNFDLLRTMYGTLALALALWGALLATVQRRPLAVTGIPYVVVALLLYSCWSRPEPRYLIGVYVFLPMLIVEGVLGTPDVVLGLVRRGQPLLAGGLVAALLLGLASLCATATVPGDDAGVRTLSWLLSIGAGVAALAAVVLRGRRVTPACATALMLALVSLVTLDTIGSLAQPRALFQGPEAHSARANLQRLVPRGGVIITSEDIGRPAENIEYYSGVPALYLTDLRRWRLRPEAAAAGLLDAGLQPYVLFPTVHPHHGPLLRRLVEHGIGVEAVAVIPAEDALVHFVASRFHRGVDLTLYRLRRAEERDQPPPDAGDVPGAVPR